MSEVLYEEEYIEAGQEYLRKVTCCMAFVRKWEGLNRTADALDALWKIMSPSVWQNVTILYPPPSADKLPLRFCPHCGGKLP